MTESSHHRYDSEGHQPATVSKQKAKQARKAKQAIEWRDLNYQDTYICPVCRHGQIAALTLMDAFACDFAATSLLAICRSS